MLCDTVASALLSFTLLTSPDLQFPLLFESNLFFPASVLLFQQRSPGKVLFDLVCVHLNLTEGDYFGLEYQDQRKMTVSDAPYLLPHILLHYLLLFLQIDI